MMPKVFSQPASHGRSLFRNTQAPNVMPLLLPGLDAAICCERHDALVPESGRIVSADLCALEKDVARWEP